MFKSLTLAMFCCLVTSNTLGNDLEEIVVTADLRARSDLETLSSVTVITDAARAQFDSTHFEDLLNWVPNLNFAGGTTRARFFQIRGIGERSQYRRAAQCIGRTHARWHRLHRHGNHC
jgi:outer membrane cobalamin receptor